ncbi:MAG: TonB-dependent receptor [Cyclobacteriaceae bacterium]
MNRLLVISACFLLSIQIQAQFTLSGVVRDFEDQLTEGATLLVLENGMGAVTDDHGIYSMTLDRGVYTIEVHYLGMESIIRRVPVYRNVDLNFKLRPAMIKMDEVITYGESEDARLKSVPGVEKLTINDIQDIPLLMGEIDVVNSIVMLPGVSTVGEGATGFNVRGGKVDQNLIQLGNAEIFNSSHMLGFFSIFNGDVVRDFSLYKGHIPANFGGRISSVLDVVLKEGSYQDWDLRMTVGTITSKAVFEGPLIENKLSIIGAYRYAYPNWIMRRVPNIDVRNSQADFNDQNLTIGYRINDLSKLKISYYRSSDLFQFSDDFSFGWSHNLVDVKLQSALSDHLIHDFTTSLVLFDNEQTELEKRYTISNGMSHFSVKDNWLYDMIKNHEIVGGVEIKSYFQNPEHRKPLINAKYDPIEVLKDRGWIASAYANDQWEITPRLVGSFGVRLNYYQQHSRGLSYTYENELEPSVYSILDTSSLTTSYSDWSLEPRVALNFNATQLLAFKASYNRINQYIHLISNTTSPTPIDVWQLSTQHIRPQSSSNYSIGGTYQGAKKIWQHSIDVFYRDVGRIYDYREFAELQLNDHLETELLEGEGRSYGIEFLIEKKKLGWTGWLAYTLSKSDIRSTSSSLIRTINQGNWYSAAYDQRHNLSVVLNKDWGRNGYFSWNFVYNTGRPFTAVESSYLVNNAAVPLYSERNNYRIPDYIRLDIGFGLKSLLSGVNDKIHFSFYNALGRDNAYSLYYRKPSKVAIIPFSYKLSVLGDTFPSVTYTIRMNRGYKADRID